MFREGWRWQCSDPPESEPEVFRAVSQVHWLQIKEEKQAGLVYLENRWTPRNCAERAGSCIFISSAPAVLAQCDILVHNNMLWDGGWSRSGINKLWPLGQIWPTACFFFVSFFKWLYLFIYFWLHWVFVAACGLSIVAASGGYSSLRCAGFSLRWLLLLWSTGSRRMDFGSCGTWAQ